jgi:hypothetical protein
MTTYAQSNPFELWSFRKSLGMVRNVIPQFSYWLPMFGQQVNSTDEYIDFEKLPALNRRLAPFVRPAGTGKPAYTDQSTGYRFKPAYIKLKDAVDSQRVLTKIPGIDSILDPAVANNPMARREALKAAIAVQHVRLIERRWEWLSAKAVIDAAVTISGEDYPAVTLDFRRDAGQTITLGSGSRWGDSGISILDTIQTWADLMFQPVGGFGGFPVRITVGSKAWAVMRKDAEIKDNMNKFFPVTLNVERGLIASEKVVKVGDLGIGGTSGVQMEVYLYRDSYQTDDGTETPILQPTDIVMTADPGALNGHRCFGAIIDPFAQYQSLDIFARNFMDDGDPAAEYLLHQSAPLMVPINPNATLKATVVAA